MRHKLLIFIILFISLVISSNAAFAVDNNEFLNLSQSSGNITVNQGSTDQNLTTETTSTPLTSVQGYWVNPSATGVDDLNPAALKNDGITDLFVLTSKQDPEGTLKPFLDVFSGSGIRIHAWIICFKDQNEDWFDPGNNTALMDNLMDKITLIATNYNIDGIHLDYVRYPGTAYNYSNATLTVTSFVQNVYNQITSLNQQAIPGKPYIYLSAALMPECEINAEYYGQDYGQLSNYLDLLIPMVYKGNYNQNTAWIGTTTQYIVQHANGKPVVTGLQTYRSDSDTTPLPEYELYEDVQAALNNGSSGYVLFRYGLVDPDFPVNPDDNTFTIEEIGAVTQTLNENILTNQKLPSYVTIGGKKVTLPQFISLLVNSLLGVSTGDETPVVLKNIGEPENPSEGIKSGNIYKTEYLELAQKLKSMDTTGIASDYVDSTWVRLVMNP